VTACSRGEQAVPVERATSNAPESKARGIRKRVAGIALALLAAVALGCAGVITSPPW
jgi:hypothetical protein